MEASGGEQPFLELCGSFSGPSAEPSSIQGLGQSPGCSAARALCPSPSPCFNPFLSTGCELHLNAALINLSIIVKAKTSLYAAIFSTMSRFSSFQGVYHPPQTSQGWVSDGQRSEHSGSLQHCHFPRPQPSHAGIPSAASLLVASISITRGGRAPAANDSLCRLQGAAADDGRLKRGDQILAVNGEALEGVTHEQAVAILKRQKGTVTLTVLSWMPLHLRR